MSEVKIPTNADEAAAMALIGMSWLENNTPERLTELHREIRAEAGRAGFVEGVRQEMLDRFGLFYHDTRDRADRYADGVRQEVK